MKGHVVARHLELEEAPFFCRVCHLKFLEGVDWAKHANSPSHRVRVMVCPSALGQNALGRSGWEFITEGPDRHAVRWGAQESRKYFDLTRSVRPQASGYTLKSLLSEVPLTALPEEEAEPESAEEDEENSYEPLILHEEEWSRHNGEDTTGAGRLVTEMEPMEDKAESAPEPAKDVAAPTPDGSVPQTVLSADQAEFALEPDKVVAPDESGPQTVLSEDKVESAPEPAKVVALDESGPQTVLSEDKAESAPEPAKEVAAPSPDESDTERVLLEDEHEAAPEPAKVVAPDESDPQTVLSEDKVESAPEPAKEVAAPSPDESNTERVLLEDEHEAAPEPAKVVAPDESGPQTVLSEDKAESAPQLAKVVAPDESDPQTVLSEDKAESAPEPAKEVAAPSPDESDTETVLLEDEQEAAPEPAKVVAPDESGPQTVLSEDKAESAPEPAKEVAAPSPDESDTETVLLEDEYEAASEPAKVGAPDESGPRTVLSEDKQESEINTETVLLEDSVQPQEVAPTLGTHCSASGSTATPVNPKRPASAPRPVAKWDRSVTPPSHLLKRSRMDNVIDLVSPKPAKKQSSKKHQARKPILEMLREVFPSPPPTTVASEPRKLECSVAVQKLPLQPPTVYVVSEDGTLTPKGKTDRPVSMVHLQKCCQIVSTSVTTAMEPIVQRTAQEKEEKDLMISLLKDLKKSNEQLLSYLKKKDRKRRRRNSSNEPPRKKHKAEQ